MSLFLVWIVVLLVFGGVLTLVVKNLLYVSQPSEVIIFSGRRRELPSGHARGYRIIRGGRALRVPLLEQVDRMDLTNMNIEVTVRNAYSKGGIPLSVQGIANVKIPGEEPLLNNTLERFLGKSRAEIMKIARETLEGNLRGVLATLTPEQVNRDKESFAQQLATEAELDFSKLGLVLDTLKIQNVSDDVGYLGSIGRSRSAAIRRDAQVAEAKAQAEAAEQKARNQRAAELAKIGAAMKIAASDNERRIADARTRREALIAAERAEVQALVAAAAADLETQNARVEQVRLALDADVLRPAEARRREAEEQAKGHAAAVVEKGRATAEVLRRLGEIYGADRGTGREVLLMQKLVPLLRQLTATLGDLKVDRLTVLAGDGGAGADAGLARRLVEIGEQVRAATGVDVASVLRDRLAKEPSRSP